MKKIILIVTLLVFSLSNAFAGTISGKVTTKDVNNTLMGANVYLKGTIVGAASDADGMYYIKVDDGVYTLVCNYVGYATEEIKLEVKGDIRHDFILTEYLFSKTISVIADRARERETPVAFSNVEKEAMEVRLGSRDIPLVLNTTPSVYATQQGGGAGDARINVRGFNQSNVAVMINGMPVNDMENGWVYWSNWDGVGDATSSIQVQRGLSAVNLATPSIGGTVNIITDPTAQNAGVKFKQEIGNDGFIKSTLLANSGLINDKYAVNGAIVRKAGDGLIDKTWTDAWAYYFGASYNINENNRLELYSLGAPQRHGQNLYKQNISVYNKSYAKDLDDYDLTDTLDVLNGTIGSNGTPDVFEKYNQVGRKYNQNWASVDPSYKGKQSWNEDIDDRYDSNFINERENFFHKPLVNLNWYSQLNDNLSLYTVLYWSGGHGGGTGTYGDIVRVPRDTSFSRWYKSSPWSWDWNATIAQNDTSSTGSFGILRNSRNNQWTIGTISKANYKVNENLNTTFGIDWRTAEIDHYREVRDLLGGEYYDPSIRGDAVSEFWSDSEMKRKLGQKIDYNFTNTVDWFGAFGQGEYSSGPITAYGMFGYSMIKYTYTNYFRTADTLATGEPDVNSGELTAESDWISGYQIKGGASYRLTDALDFYGNFGYVSKVPIFDHVINDRDGTKAEDPENEKFTSIETGINFKGLDGQLSSKSSFYYTTWKNRSNSIGITNPDGTEGLIFITGMDSRHIGAELEVAYQPHKMLRLDAAVSIGNWEYTDDVSGVYKDYASGGAEEDTVNYYVKNLKVGDAPQTQFALAASIFPIKGLTTQLVFKHYREHYADFDPFSRTDDRYPNVGGDRGVQSWKTPCYNLVDLHLAYDLPVDLRGIKLQMFAHVFNLLDEDYIQDATDNSRYNSWDNDHDADDAEVFFGLPRTFNIGLSLVY